MTGFLTFLTFLANLTVWPEYHGFPVRIVRFSDISDCARGEKSIFLSLSFPQRVFATRARKQICQKTPTLIQQAQVVPKMARGNEFAQAYFKHVNSFEFQQRSDEVEAAFAWHPTWHKSGDHSWGCDTPDDPEVWETDKLLAQYRRRSI